MPGASGSVLLKRGAVLTCARPGGESTSRLTERKYHEPMKRWIAGILAMCCLMAVLPAQIFAAGSTANVTKAVEEAAVPQASSTKLIALTFDDGPGPYTQKLLDGLAKRGVKVTFFVQGCNAEVYSDTLKREYNDGHQVANHTYNHPQLTKQSDAKVIWQVTKNAGILDKACGSGTSYILRPPYGDYNSHVLSLIGCPAVTWSVDPVDWRDRNATTVSDRIVAGAFDGAIVLVHDIHSTSVTGALDASLSRSTSFSAGAVLP
jgi:peptidoglycan/xylan/chitin deacetylase (PgdA/CDA1 family)